MQTLKAFILTEGARTLVHNSKELIVFIDLWLTHARVPTDCLNISDVFVKLEEELQTQFHKDLRLTTLDADTMIKSDEFSDEVFLRIESTQCGVFQ